MTFALGALALVGFEPTNAPPSLNIGLVLQGRTVYQRNCIMCHGQKGDGRGDMGLTVRPRPRNFRDGVFKFRSTPSGFLPTEEDLARTIRLGLSGTAMPSFGALLREREVRAVIEYLKTFSKRWEHAENYCAPVAIPASPAWLSKQESFTAHAAHGKELFAATCAPCHGANADGRGSPVTQLTDAFAEPIAPSDLREPLRCGNEAPDIYRVLVTGLDGTPMPSFVEGMTDQQRWDVIAYILELRHDSKLRSGNRSRPSH
jgi:mono/diheme cytochrome c family protein